MCSNNPYDSVTDFQTFREFYYDYRLNICLIKAKNPDNVIASASRLLSLNRSD
jgi:hypothetical protein